jgi:nucleotide-binding universal stress UspA family protein
VREQDPKGAVESSKDSPETELKAGAKESRKAQQQDEQKLADATAAEQGGKAAKQPEKPKVPVTNAQAEPDSAEAAVAKESEKGYDLLILGVADTLGPDGALHQDLAKIAAGFAGPLGVVIGRGPHLEDPTVSRFKILVPVSGNNVSRRAAEVAVALARANDIPITFLYVAGGDRKKRGAAALHRHELAVLKELVAWAERYDTEARTAIHTNVAPQEAILGELKRGKFDLVVMGVNRRPGDSLFFGNVAGAVIEDTKASVLLLSS